MKQKLLLIALMLFVVKGFSQAIAFTPPNMVTCSNEVYDLTTQTFIVLGNQDPLTHTVNYFTSLTDAEQNENAITDPSFYILDWNPTQSNTIYVRVDNQDDGSFDITHFEVTMLLSNSFAQLADLVACDEDGDGIATFDMNNIGLSLFNGSDPVANVTFYLTLNDAQTQVNPIADPGAFVNTNPFEQTVYMRFNGTGCSGIGQFDVVATPCANNSIAGTVTYDADNDGCGEGDDVPAAGIVVSYTNGNMMFHTFTDVNGNYIFYNVPDGDNTVSVQSLPSFTALPANIEVVTPGNLSNIDFCLTMPQPVNDVSVMVYPASLAIPGFPSSYILVYQNVGNQVSSGVISFEFDSSLVTYVSSEPAMTLMGSNMLTFSYSDLQPFQSGYIAIELEVMQPDTVNSGDILPFTAIIDAVVDDNPDNNIFNLNQVVVNAYDPNDIRCHEGELITEAQADGYLHYTIRFQNEGDAEAINVRIETELDAKLDWDTFEPVAASHSYVTERSDSGVKFIFNNIYLTYADNDFDASQGYVMYRIKPKSTVEVGDTMTAQAGIIFNFNQPIYTNAYSTTVGTTAATDSFTESGFTMYPNPASANVTLQLQDVSGTADVIVADVLGKTVLTGKIQNNQQDINISSLNSGLYFVTIAAEGKTITKKLVVK